MLALKKGETTSLLQYSNVIFVFSVVISIILLNACIQSSVATEAETSFAPEHIEKSCIEKCPDQVSWIECFVIVDEKKRQDSKWGSEFLFLFLVVKSDLQAAKFS